MRSFLCAKLYSVGLMYSSSDAAFGKCCISVVVRFPLLLLLIMFRDSEGSGVPYDCVLLAFVCLFCKKSARMCNRRVCNFPEVEAYWQFTISFSCVFRNSAGAFMSTELDGRLTWSSDAESLGKCNDSCCAICCPWTFIWTKLLCSISPIIGRLPLATKNASPFAIDDIDCLTSSATETHRLLFVL